MKALTIPLKQKLTLILLSILTISFNPAMAESDKQIMQDVKKDRETSRQQGDHSKHAKSVSKTQEYHGVFYGYLPCKDCAGIKTTLSLKNKNNYLIVTQHAKKSTREYFEKGKYNWNDETSTLTLTPRRGADEKKYRIIDEKTLLMLTSGDEPSKADLEKYTLRKIETAKPRKMHNH